MAGLMMQERAGHAIVSRCLWEGIPALRRRCGKALAQMQTYVSLAGSPRSTDAQKRVGREEVLSFPAGEECGY
jgi:hypothetical protein